MKPLVMKNLINLLILLLVVLAPSYGEDFTEAVLSQYEEIRVPTIQRFSVKGKTIRIELGLTETEYNQSIREMGACKLPLFVGQATMVNERGDVLYNLLLDESGAKYKDCYREEGEHSGVVYKKFKTRDDAHINPKRGTYILSFKVYKHKNIKQDVRLFVKVQEIDNFNIILTIALVVLSLSETHCD